MFQGRTQFHVSLSKRAVSGKSCQGQTHVSLIGAGLFSSVMRDLANITHKGPKWIILDGDIDPMWIESLNTVMDDNKVSVITPQELCLLISWGDHLHLCLGPKIRASSHDGLLSPGSHLGQQ